MKFYKFFQTIFEDEEDNFLSQELETPESEETDDLELDVDDEVEEKEEEEKEEEEKPKEDSSKKSNKKARDTLISKFNKENQNISKIKLVALEDENETENGFRVSYQIDTEEIYLNKEKYDKGLGYIELNEVFINDLDSMARQLGISIQWKKDDTGKYGLVTVN